MQCLRNGITHNTIKTFRSINYHPQVYELGQSNLKPSGQEERTISTFIFAQLKLWQNQSLFLKMAILGLFFHFFSSFQTSITILTKNKCEKCPSSTWCWDSNSQLLEHESPTITTRPVANLIKHFMIVNYDDRVELTTNLPIL